jgi:hypothetical protein
MTFGAKSLYQTTYVHALGTATHRSVMVNDLHASPFEPHPEKLEG